MKRPHIPRIREYLRQNSDGATAVELAQVIGADQSAIRRTMSKHMPDAYIDRWAPTGGQGASKYAAIWCVVQVPDHCPRPQ